MTNIAGYTFGTTETVSPMTLTDLENLKTALLFSEEDVHYLNMAGEVLADQVEDVLDVWYGFVGSTDHLLYYFTDGRGNADIAYMAAVRKRFCQWILDLCQRPYDQTWLNYQHEIALRHHRIKKNQVDEATAVDHIDLRYMIAFIVPITVTIKSFLMNKGHDADTVEKMFQAWFKAVVLSVILWSVPYIEFRDF